MEAKDHEKQNTKTKVQTHSLQLTETPQKHARPTANTLPYNMENLQQIPSVMSAVFDKSNHGNQVSSGNY